jgi:hypothetical protein
MFTDSIGRFDDNGLGPMIELIAIIYLCYLAVYKNIKVQSSVFLLYAIGSLLFISRYKNLLQSDATLNHKPTSPISYELINIYVSSALCIITAVLVW